MSTQKIKIGYIDSGTAVANQVVAFNGSEVVWTYSFSPTDDNSTNATYYPLVATEAGGSTAKTSSTKLSFNPSTGILSANTLNSMTEIKIQGDTVIYDNKIFKVGSGTTAQRPASPSIGMIWYNTDISRFEGYDGNEWLLFGGTNPLTQTIALIGY